MERITDEYAQMELAGRRVIIGLSDGYPNGSRLIKDMGREYKTWRRSSKTQRYLEEVSRHTGLDESELLRLVSAGRSEIGCLVSGTYTHPLVFTHILHWLSPSLGVAMADWIEEWKKVEGNANRYWQALGMANVYEEDTAGSERIVQERLAELLGAEMEVCCSTGRIDLLTDQLLIEVKCSRYWKAGVGQLLVYGREYPDHEKVLYLFDARPSRVVREACSDLGVRVVWKEEQVM